MTSDNVLVRPIFRANTSVIAKGSETRTETATVTASVSRRSLESENAIATGTENGTETEIVTADETRSDSPNEMVRTECPQPEQETQVAVVAAVAFVAAGGRATLTRIPVLTGHWLSAWDSNSRILVSFLSGGSNRRVPWGSSIVYGAVPSLNHSGVPLANHI